MLMFVYLFGGALGPHGHYVQYVVPGVTLVCVGFGAAMTAVSVATDLSGGVIDRFRAMDVSGQTLVNGHVVAGVLRNLLTTSIVITVAYGIGFRAHAGAAYSVGGKVRSDGVGNGDHFDGSRSAEPFFGFLGGMGAGAGLVLLRAAGNAADGVA